jgi:hypothetical protein
VREDGWVGSWSRDVRATGGDGKGWG